MYKRQGIHTLWTVPDTDRIKRIVEERKPETAAVIGGGFIGLEMAENLQKAEMCIRDRSRELSQMQDEGIIKMEGRKSIKILDYSRLQEDLADVSD